MTTIVSVRRHGKVVIGGDGQVSLGNTVMKGNARKVRRLYKDQVIAGFAGGTADAFTLFERFEAQLEKHQGNLVRAAVELRGVVKRYRRTRALDGLDLRVPRGTLVGLVGPNGAGKTTTFGIISGVLEPDEGTVDVLGSGPFHPRAQAGALGVLPQDCALNPHSSARQLLTFFGRLQGLTRAEATREADRLLDELRLGDRATSRVGELSHGMKRRLAVAQAPTPLTDDHYMARKVTVTKPAFPAVERAIALVQPYFESTVLSRDSQVGRKRGGGSVE